jgi:hypothetical protein
MTKVSGCRRATYPTPGPGGRRSEEIQIPDEMIDNSDMHGAIRKCRANRTAPHEVTIASNRTGPIFAEQQ